MSSSSIRQIPRPVSSVPAPKPEKVSRPAYASSPHTLTAERLRELLDYSSETGVFTRKVSTSTNARAGDVAGTLMQIGYLSVQLDGRKHLMHRLAWLYVYGTWPTAHLDHINRIRTDNRICNLREATHTQNARNMSKASNNTSGHPGVHWRSDRAKWWALIESDGQKHYLGCYSTIEEAIAARKAGELKYWGVNRAD